MRVLGRWLSKEDRPLLYPHIQPKISHETFEAKNDKVDGYLCTSLSFKVSHDILDSLFFISPVMNMLINMNNEKHTSYLKTKKLIPT